MAAPRAIDTLCLNSSFVEDSSPVSVRKWIAEMKCREEHSKQKSVSESYRTDDCTCCHSVDIRRLAFDIHSVGSNLEESLNCGAESLINKLPVCHKAVNFLLN